MLLYTVPVLAQIKGSEIRVVVSPDHTDWTYRLKKRNVPLPYRYTRHRTCSLM